MDTDQIDKQDLKWGGAGPRALEQSVLLTLGGIGLLCVGLPLLAFGGTIMIFGAILSGLGGLALGFGFVRGGLFLLAGYIKDFMGHWQKDYILPALGGGLFGLFLSLLYLPAAPVLVIFCTALAVHLARKIKGDTAFPSYPPVMPPDKDA